VDDAAAASKRAPRCRWLSQGLLWGRPSHSHDAQGVSNQAILENGGPDVS